MKEDALREVPQFLTIPDVAKFCGVTRNTVYVWVRQGKLTTYKTPGRTNYIRSSELVKFMQANGMFVTPGLMELARMDEKLGSPTSREDGKKGPSILVVDDDPLIRAVVNQALGELYTIYQAETGYEALHILTLHNDIDLVLMDVRMPGQLGFETVMELKKNRPKMAVIMLTGFTEDIPENVLKDPVVKKVLEKPVDATSLKEAVSEVLRKAKK